MLIRVSKSGGKELEGIEGVGGLPSPQVSFCLSCSRQDICPQAAWGHGLLGVRAGSFSLAMETEPMMPFLKGRKWCFLVMCSQCASLDQITAHLGDWEQVPAVTSVCHLVPMVGGLSPLGCQLHGGRIMGLALAQFCLNS